MRHYQLLFVLLLLFSCKGKSDAGLEMTSSNSATAQEAQTSKAETTIPSPKNSSSGLFFLEKATKDDFEKARANYKDSYLKDTLNIRKIDGAIKIKTGRSWQPYVVFTDTLLGTDDDEIRQYQYVGQYKELDKYLVIGSFWEHSECYLIDKATGQVTTLWTCPSISPDKKLLANLSMPYGLEGIPNGIQIWKAEHEYQNKQGPIVLSKFIELDQQVWAPDDFVWESAKSIIIKTFPTELFWETGGEPAASDFNYLRLSFD
jgi:hypothetical protein